MPRWAKTTRAERKRKSKMIVASARRRVDGRFDLIDGGLVGELCTGALLLRLADLAERNY